MISFDKGSLTFAIWSVYRSKAIFHKASGGNGAVSELVWQGLLRDRSLLNYDLIRSENHAFFLDKNYMNHT